MLRPGGTAVIDDLRRGATRADIALEVDAMGLSRANATATRLAPAWLRRRALPAEQFERLADRSAFGGCAVEPAGVGLRVRLVKAP